jgi:hypothetical protein
VRIVRFSKRSLDALRESTRSRKATTADLWQVGKSLPGLKRDDTVRHRLLNIANNPGEDFGLVLTRYALARILFPRQH